jgi:hypothetical protein
LREHLAKKVLDDEQPHGRYEYLPWSAATAKSSDNTCGCTQHSCVNMTMHSNSPALLLVAVVCVGFDLERKCCSNFHTNIVATRLRWQYAGDSEERCLQTTFPGPLKRRHSTAGPPAGSMKWTTSLPPSAAAALSASMHGTPQPQRGCQCRLCDRRCSGPGFRSAAPSTQRAGSRACSTCHLS